MSSTARSTPIAGTPLPTRLIVEVEGEPGHFVDLSLAFEFDDDGTHLLVIFPAPNISDAKLKIKPGDGPHSLCLTGESRALALRYLRWCAQQAQGWLQSI